MCKHPYLVVGSLDKTWLVCYKRIAIGISIFHPVFDLYKFISQKQFTWFVSGDDGFK